MLIGFRVPYARGEPLRLCFRLAQWALDLGLDVRFLPPESPTFSHAYWDRFLVPPGPLPAVGIDHFIYVKPPGEEEASRLARRSADTLLLLLWEHLTPADPARFGLFDRVVFPAKAPLRLLQMADAAACLIPWDPDVPPTRREAGVDPRRTAVLWDLDGERQAHADVQGLLRVLRRVLARHPACWLTVVYDGDAAGTTRALHKAAQAASGRIELVRSPGRERRELLYNQHDLVLWPNLSESTGHAGLTALSMGAPVLAFDHPVIGEIVRDGFNGELVPCELVFSAAGVPKVAPDYDRYGRQLADLLASPERIEALRRRAFLGLAERRSRFLTEWKTILLS